MHIPISRRAALKASGIAIALPLLESMNPAIGREVATSPKRMVLICTTLGLHPPSLFPKTPGGDYESTEYLALLKKHRDDFTLFSGLSLLQTDSSRVITMVIQDHLIVPKIKGVTAEHHNLSHHGQDPEKIKQLKIIETEIMKSVADFLSSMARSSEGDERSLDRTSVLFGSNLGNANAHDPHNLPILLAGGGYRHGRCVAYDAAHNTPLCNLFVSLLNRMDVRVESFATSTGELTW